MRVPVLTYHSNNVGGNDYANNDHVALAADLRRIRALGLRIVPLSLVVDNLAFEHAGPNALQLSGQISINGEAADLNVITEQAGGRASRLVATLSHADLTPFALKRNEQGEIRQGLNAFGALTISAVRAADGVKPSLNAALKLDPGLIYVDGDSQELTDGQINLGYDFDKQTLEIARSQLQLGATILPLTGAVIDLDKLDPDAGKGFGIDALISGGTAAPNSGEQPLSFDLQATGRYLVAGREFQFANMVASSPLAEDERTALRAADLAAIWAEEG